MTRPKGAERPLPKTTSGRGAQRGSRRPGAFGCVNQLAISAVLGPPAAPTTKQLPEPLRTPLPPLGEPEILKNFPHVKIFANVIGYLHVNYSGVIDAEVLDLLYEKVERDPRSERAHLWQIEGYLLSALEQMKGARNPERTDQIRMYIRAASWFSHPRFSIKELCEQLDSFARYHAEQYDFRSHDSLDRQEIEEMVAKIRAISSVLQSNTFGKALLSSVEQVEQWIADARQKLDRAVRDAGEDPVWDTLNETLFDEEMRPMKEFKLSTAPKPVERTIRTNAQILLWLRGVRDELLFRYLYPETMRSVIR